MVFGQGLALRGPPGSMIKAINAFIYYQHHILFSFTMNIVFLGLSTIFQYYVFMTLLGAHICCVITILGMLVWHKYCLKVFNRFKFANESINWTKRDDDINEQRNSQGEIDDDPTHRYEKNSTRLIEETRGNTKKSDVSWRKKVFSKLLFSNATGNNKKDDPEPDVDYNTNPMSSSSGSDIHQHSTNPVFRRSSNTRPEDANFDNILFHGTLDTRTLNTATNPTSNWMRKYIIILANGALMTYNSRSDYENNHMNSLCKAIKPFDIPTQSKIPYTSPSDDRREALNIIIMSTDKKSSFNGIEFRFFTVDDSNTCFKIISNLHDIVEDLDLDGDEDAPRTMLSDNSIV